MKVLKRHGAIILLGAVALYTLVFRSTYLDTDPDSYRFTDHLSEDLPMIAYGHERLSSGELPLWNPYQAGGAPALASLQHRYLYPPRALFNFAVGIVTAHTLETLFHFFWAPLGMFLFLRSGRRLHAFVAACGGLLYSLSTYFINDFGELHNHTAALAWIPWCFWAVDRALTRPGLDRAITLGVVGACAFYAGYPQYLYYSGQLLALFAFMRLALIYRDTRKRLIPTMVWLCLGSLISLLLVLGQLIATYQMAAASSRPVMDFTPNQALVPVDSLPGVIAHLYAPAGSALGATILLSVLGIASLLVVCSQRRQLPVNLVWILGATGSILIAAGELTPVALLYQDLFPMADSFRIQTRALVIAMIAVPALLCTATHGAIARLRVRHGSLNRLARVVVLALLLFGTLALHGGQRFDFILFSRVSNSHQNFADQARDALAPRLAGGRFASVCGFELMPCKKLGTLIGIQQLNEYDPLASLRYYYMHRLIQTQVRYEETRQIWLGTLKLNWYDLLDNPRSIALLRLSGVRALISDASGFAQLPEAMQSRAARSTELRPVPEFELSENDLFIEMFMHSQQEEREFISAFLERNRKSDYHLYMVPDPLPRAFTIDHATVVHSLDEAYALMSDPQFAPLREFVIESDGRGGLERFQDGGITTIRPVEVVEYEPERVVLEVDVESRSLLVITDHFYPGWTATVDGQPAHIYPIDILYRAVSISPGPHRVEFTYRVPWVIMGLVISVIVAVAVVGYGAARAAIMVHRRLRPPA